MLVLAGAAVFSVAGVAQADHLTTSVSYDSTSSSFRSFENTGASFTATWTYDAHEATLTLSLVNTSAGPYSGAITAVAFNDPNSPLPPPDSGPSLLTFLGVSGDDDGAWAVGGVTPSPNNIGNFNSIYTVDGTDYTGAGDGMTGIENGETAVFTWTTGAADALSLTVFDFLNRDLNTHGFGFAVRFKGIGSEGDSDQIVLVPLPMALPMGLAGLLCVVIFRRRK